MTDIDCPNCGADVEGSTEKPYCSKECAEEDGAAPSDGYGHNNKSMHGFAWRAERNPEPVEDE